MKGGDGSCPSPECRRTIDGDEIEGASASWTHGPPTLLCRVQRGAHQGLRKDGNAKTEKVRVFRAPRPEDDVEALVQQRLVEKMPLWQARNIVPDEEFPPDTNDDRPRQYGAALWRDLFNPRQFYGHCVSVEVFQDLFRNSASRTLTEPR